jgi:hypothetical protein
VGDGAGRAAPYGERVTGGERWAWLRARRLSEQELSERGIRAEELGRDDPLWPGRLATLVALLVYPALPSKLTIGPNWPLPAVGVGLLVGLVLATRGGRKVEHRREIEVGLLLVVALVNLIALGLLTHYLLAGGTPAART